MKRRLSQLQRTAYHEAGHAVAACVMRHRFTRVTIEPEEDTLGKVNCARVPTYAPDVDRETSTRVQTEKRVIVYLAGLIAEQTAAGCAFRGPGLSGDDLQKAYSYAGHMCGDDAETEAYVAWLWERTRLLVTFEPNWTVVEALASELMKRKTIGERAARSIMGEARKNPFRQESAQGERR